MHKKALVLSEVFWPEDFIINDLVDDWLAKGYSLEVLTRNPSYPFGRVTDGYKNNLYIKSVYKNTFVHRFFVFPGYQNSLLIKILNYVTYMFICFWFLLFNGKKYDKIFIYQTGPLTNAFSPVLLKTIFKYKITIWSQDLWPDTIYAYGLKKNKITKFILNNLVRFIYNGCDIILISCKGFNEKIEKLLKKKTPIHWIPNWPIVDGFSAEKEGLPKGFNFTFAGNIGKVQNLDQIVRAFKSVSEKYSDAYLNIIGDGSYLEELKTICKIEKIKNINFTGRKPVSKMPHYFAASEVLLISLIDVPLYEIMIPSKFQTYLTANKPIYSVMKGEVAQLVTKYNIGISANPSNIKAIEKGFIQLLNYPENQLKLMANNSKSLLHDNFDELKTKQKIFDLFWL
jgi:glycosyltransferase involved in cell wall biosynthesis